MKLFRSAISVGLFTALSRVFGFGREWFQAHYIGASAVSDALNYAISFPSFFRRIFAEGAFNASFIPLFTEIYTCDGTKEAQRFAESILSLLSGILTVVVLLVVLFTDTIMPFFLPGLTTDSERLQLTIEFTRITFPFLLLISLTAFFSGMLNSLERFIAAASSPAVGNLAIVATLVSLSDFGVNPGKSLAIGVLACGILQFLWVFIPSQKTGIPVRLVRPKFSPKVILFLKRMLPAALGASVVQINLIVDVILSSYLPKGAFSYLKYADRFNQLPLSIIGTAISTALLPLMARQLREKNFEGARESQNRAIEFTLFFILPATVGIVFLATPLIEVFYMHGKFTQDNVIPTSQTLMVLASGLPAYVLVKVFNTSFFSRGDTRTPVITALISVFINFALNMTLIWTFQQIGMAIATACASWMNACILGYILWRQKHLGFDVKFLRFFPRVCLSTLILCVYLAFAPPILINTLSDFMPWEWLTILITVVGGVVIYVTTSHMLNIFTFSKIKEHMKRQ